MRGTQFGNSIAAATLAVMVYIPTTQAIPINENTLDKDGALFTIEGEWTSSSTYQLTYWANFDGFDNSGGDDFLKAIDWQWQGGEISSVILKNAPGSRDDWAAIPEYQINYANVVGCAPGGGVSAVCTEYVGEGAGLSTALSGDLAWVFQVNFKTDRQLDLIMGRGPRAGLLGDSLPLASPLSIRTAAFAPDPLNGQVPAPGVLSLMLIGLGLLIKGRRTSIKAA